MRYALVSDIHANIQAWKVVYEDIQSNTVDKIICLGDVIGYGPNPAEVLKEVRAKVDAFVLGNHDAVVCDKLDVSLFNDDARLLIEWTRKQLSKEDIEFVGAFPLTLIGDGFLCVHGEFAEPGNFDYVLEANDALPSWKATESNLLVVGHTHEPALYVLGSSGIPRTVDLQDFAVDPGKRYFVNIGSVGQPRGSDNRACYCIYDTETKSIYWRHVAFDLEAYRKALKATGLTLDPSYYMLPEETKPDTGTAPAKKRIVYTPPKSKDQAARNVVASQDLKNIPARKKKIPLNLVSTLVVLVILLVVFIWKRTHPALDFNNAGQRVIAASSKTLLPSVREVVDAGQEIPGWTTHIDNRYHQRIGVNLDPFGQPFFYLTSKDEKEGLLLASPWIAVQSNLSWDVDASFQEKKDFKGTTTLAISLIRDKNGKKVEIRDFFVRSPEAGTPTGWNRIRERFTLPETGGLIQFQVRGQFKGTLLIRQMTLAPARGDAPPQSVKSSSEPPASETTNDPWKQKIK